MTVSRKMVGLLKKPFNFNGYICPAFSLIWGMAITFVVQDLQGSLERISSSTIPERIEIPVLAARY
ncbi:MAG: putative ABC transporter permease [Clostridiales bacterium]|nr:putative ABC transporter permease [Clostridiales bacterium]